MSNATDTTNNINILKGIRDSSTDRTIVAICNAAIDALETSGDSPTFDNITVSTLATILTAAITTANITTANITTANNTTNVAGVGSFISPSYTFVGNSGTGFYLTDIGDIIGVAINGVIHTKFDPLNGLLVTRIKELNSGSGIIYNGNLIEEKVAVSVTTGTTLSAAQVMFGYIQVASGGAGNITLPANLGTSIGAVAGRKMTIIIDNTQNTGTITLSIAGATGATLGDGAVGGGTVAFGKMTVANIGGLATNAAMAEFTLLFNAANTYIITRTA